MTSKNLHTLVEDIYSLFKEPTKVNPSNLEEFKETVGAVVKQALEEAGTARDFEVRMSNIGTPDRKMWYQSRTKSAWNPPPKDSIKFLYGHIVEALLLFLVKEAGHTVEKEQHEVSLDGVKGHIDCVIDGAVIDVKSASTFSFNKFTSGNIMRDDPFGYRHQLAGYHETVAPESEELGWLVADKQHGEIALVTFDEIEFPSASERIEEVREFLSKDEPPEHCYKPSEDKYGNQVLAKGCVYCPFKSRCWPTLRVFRYKANDAFYVDVKKLPRVPEVTQEYKDKDKCLDQD